MKRWIRRSAAVVGGIAGGAAVAVGVAGRFWDRSTARAVQRLVPGAASKGQVFSLTELQGLPLPVARYFQFALTPGQPLIRSARIEHAGEFRGGLDAPWSPFTSVQHFTASPPGFVWDARIRMAPLVTVRVRDSYIEGVGSMHGKAASLVTVVDQTGQPAINAGALHRYLAEAVWLPTALLPSQGVVWEPIDDTTARATLTDAGASVSLEFQFAPTGEIVRTFTPERYRDVNGTGVPTPWAGKYRRYAQVAGTRVPMEGEVAWMLPEGELTYWRGRLVKIEYETQ
jgi:hypothetical protein